MRIRQFSEFISKVNLLNSISNLRSTDSAVYRPTPYLTHPFLQSIYNISEPLIQYQFEREKIFF